MRDQRPDRHRLGCVDQMSHGGKRKGAGRKPAPDGTAKVPMTIKVEPQVREYLRQQGQRDRDD